MRALLCLPLMMIATPALAAQVVSPTVFEGTYDLWCTSADVSVNVGIQLVTPAGSQGFSDVATLVLACETDPADLQASVDAVEADCVAAGLPASACMTAADDLYAAVLPLANLGTTALPTSMVFDIDTANWWGRWFGVYPATALHTWDDGRAERWSYLFDNTAGYPEGHFVSFAAGIGDTAGAEGAGCAVTGTAVIDGYIRRAQGFAVQASFGINQSLTCAATDQAGSLLVVTLGLTAGGKMGGHKVP